MKNITISLEEKTARWVRVWAAKHEKSVSRMIGDLLSQQMEASQGYDRAMRRYLKRKPVALKLNDESYPSRDELYDR